MSTITKYAMVQSAKAFNTVSRKHITATAQIKMEIVKGDNKQVVAFGYARTGGRGTFMTVDGKAPVSITKRDFLDKLRAGNVQGLDAILSRLSKLSSLHSDKFIMAKCECCAQPNVTAANMDFMQRNHAKLAEKLNMTLTAFSKVCYSCQGKGPKVVGTQTSKAVVAEVAVAYTTEKKTTKVAANCAACGNGIQSQRVADFAIKQFGEALCYGKCQNDAKKASEASPVTPVACKSCQVTGVELHVSGNCEGCWADEVANDMSLPFVGVPAAPVKAEVKAATKQEKAAKQATFLGEEVAEVEEEIAIDTTDLNALLDADALVLDFLDTEEVMTPVAASKKEVVVTCAGCAMKLTEEEVLLCTGCQADQDALVEELEAEEADLPKSLLAAAVAAERLEEEARVERLMNEI